MDRQSVKSNGSTTRVKSTSIIPVNNDSNSLTAAKQEEWTTSRKVVNHKTRQVETRVKRQIVMEDGKVIADSGPQVTTKTKEDQKKEETENTNHKNIGDVDVPPGAGYLAVPGGNHVVNEKIETHQSSKEAKEENIQYHDESFKELTGLEIHRKALQAPNELIQIDSDDETPDRIPKGKLVHYSSKSNKINDSEEVKETSRLGRDGNVTTESTRTHHHEEFNDDEVPEENQEPRKALPESSTETSRRVEHLKNYDQGFDNFSNAMNRQNLRSIENRKTTSRKEYADESGNNGTTDRWLDDHFGSSDESDIVETSKTRTGKNVINVSRTGRTSTPISAISGDYHSVDRRNRLQQRSSKSGQRYTSTANYYAKDSRSPSPTDYYRPSSRASRIKEDASVQASLSDDEERSNDFKGRTQKISFEKQDRSRRTDSRADSRSETPSRPERTFYFGDDSHQRREHRSDKQIIEEYLNKQKYSTEETHRKSDYNNNEDSRGYVTANIHSNSKSTLNNRVLDESKFDDNFERSFKGDKERDDVEHNLNRFMDWDNHYKSIKSTEEKPYWESTEPKTLNTSEYIHPVIQDDFYSSKRDPLTRQRNFDSYVSPPPLYSDTDYKYRPSTSPPTSSGDTWTKYKTRTRSPLFRSSSPTDNFPKFSPLSTNALQIKSFTDAYANGRNHSSN